MRGAMRGRRANRLPMPINSIEPQYRRPDSEGDLALRLGNAWVNSESGGDRGPPAGVDEIQTSALSH